MRPRLLDMQHFAELRGYRGKGYRHLTLDNLLELKSPFVPIDQYGYPHFVVVRGLDRKGRVSIASNQWRSNHQRNLHHRLSAKLAQQLVGFFDQSTQMGSPIDLLFCVAAVLQGVSVAPWRTRTFGAVHAASRPAGDGRRQTRSTAPRLSPTAGARTHRSGIAWMGAGHFAKVLFAH